MLGFSDGSDIDRTGHFFTSTKKATSGNFYFKSQSLHRHPIHVNEIILTRRRTVLLRKRELNFPLPEIDLL